MGLHNRLDYLYNSVCHDCGGAIAEHSHNAELAAGKNPLEQFSKGLLKSFSNAFKKLYINKGYKPEDLTKEPEFKKAIESTYEVLNFGIKDNVVDGTLLRKLQQNTFLFSAFKTHAELTEAASRLLLNADKKIRPWFDFKQETLKLHQSYNVNYLEAEYEFAKQSSMMADKWQREVIERSRNADDNYWLQYRTAGDERVRESHAALHDTTLPKSDPFWSHYYPPNGWRCRCTTVSVRPDKYPMSDSTEAIKKGEAATTQIGKDGKNKLEIFRFNPGKEQVVFPKNNAYSKVVGADKVKDAINKETAYKSYSIDRLKELYKNQNIDELKESIIMDNGYVANDKSFDINEKLRKSIDLSDNDKRIVNALDDLINANKLKNNVMLYRNDGHGFIESHFGISVRELDNTKAINKIKETGITKISDKAFFSTSAVKDVNAFTHRKIHLEVRANKGTNAFVADNFLESEIILGRNQKFNIIDILDKNDKIKIILETD